MALTGWTAPPVDGMYRESLLKAVLAAPSVAPVFKNLRHLSLIKEKSLTAMPLPQITTAFAQAESRLLVIVHLLDINSCK